MSIPNTTVIELLKNAKKLSAEQLASLEAEASSDKADLEDLVIKQNITTDVELTQLFADEIGIPYTEINVKELDKEILKQLPENIAKLYNMVVFGGSIDVLEEPRLIAMVDPDD